MKMLRRLIERLTDKSAMSGYPRAQEIADVWHGLLLTSFYRENVAAKRVGGEAAAVDADALIARCEGEERTSQKAIVNGNINRQLVGYFDLIRREAAEDNEGSTASGLQVPAYKRVAMQREDPRQAAATFSITSAGNTSTDAKEKEEEDPWYEEDSETNSPEKYRELQARRRAAQRERDAASNALIRKAMMREIGYCLHTRPSGIDGAGLGLFVEGVAPAGAVVGVFPGYVHLTEFIVDEEYCKSLFPDPNLFVFTRIDNTMIDCRTADQLPQSPLALAHMANHGKPNVLQLSYSYPRATCDLHEEKDDAFPQELRDLVPNVYARKPTLLGGHFDRSMFCDTAVLVATRKLQDEEVFVDYRLNPTLESMLPPWYEHVNEEEDLRRWEEKEKQTESQEEEEEEKEEKKQQMDGKNDKGAPPSSRE